MKSSSRDLNQSSSINRKSTANNLNSLNSNQLNNSINLGTNASAFFDHKTFVKVFYADNRVILLNSLCSCLHMLNYLKEQLSLSKDELIDLIDFDGNLKEIPNLNSKDYAIQFLAPTVSYAVLKVDLDTNTNEKRYTPILNENKLTPSMTKTLANLNAGKTVNKRMTKESRLKSQNQLLNQNSAQNANSSANSQSQTSASSANFQAGQSVQTATRKTTRVK